jgi:hypothetical protein
MGDEQRSSGFFVRGPEPTELVRMGRLALAERLILPRSPSAAALSSGRRARHRRFPDGLSGRSRASGLILPITLGG